MASACAALPLLNRVGVLEVAAALGVAALSGWTAWRVYRMQADTAPVPLASVPGDAEDQLHDLSHLLEGILPVWLQHVESVRSQTETAIGQLLTSFSSITAQFEAAGFKGANGGVSEQPQDGMNLLTLCERELQPVIASMTSMLAGKDAMAASVKELSTATRELQDMASSVSHIAAQTNLLAINAAIEAARAGDSGRGFAVIAKEIRSLSQTSAQTGRQITERVAQVTKIMMETSAAATKASTEDSATIEISGSVVEDVLCHVRELSVEGVKMRAKGNVIYADVEDLLVSLQFQDRVGQIIAVIDTDIHRLKDLVASDLAFPCPEEWLSDLQQQYTMDDQRHVHAPGGSGLPAPAGAPAAAEAAVFF